MSDSANHNLIEAVQRDHREVEQMLEAVMSVSGEARRQAFAQLAAKLRVHEAAEQQVVHPLTAEEGDVEEAEALRAGESAAANELQELEGLDVDSPEFANGFARLKADVLEHAQEEEREEHPRLQSETSDEELERRGEEFQEVERLRPTADESVRHNLISDHNSTSRAELDAASTALTRPNEEPDGRMASLRSRSVGVQREQAAVERRWRRPATFAIDKLLGS